MQLARNNFLGRWNPKYGPRIPPCSQCTSPRFSTDRRKSYPARIHLGGTKMDSMIKGN